MRKARWCFVVAAALLFGCGKQQESKTPYSLITGNGSEVFSAVAVDSDGSVYAVGTTTSYGAGSNDILLAKFSAGLELEWIKAVGDSSTQTAQDIAVTADAVYVCGVHGADGFLAKFQKDGTLLWAKSWDDTNANTFKHLLVQGGNIYVVGSTYTTTTKSDAVFVKFDTDGTHIWSRQWGTDESDSLNAVAHTAGAFWAVGYTAGAGGTRDIAVVKITESSGLPNLDNAWCLQTNGDDRAFCVLASGNNLTIAATSDNFGDNHTNIILLQLDTSPANPAIVTSRFCEIGTNCTVTGLSTTPSGLYAICGSYANKPLYVEAQPGGGFYPFAYGGPNLTQGAFTDAASGGDHNYLAGWADKAESMWSALNCDSDDASFTVSSLTSSWTAPTPTVSDLSWSSEDVTPSGSGGTEGLIVRPH